MDFLNDLQINQNQLINVVLHQSATAPASPVEGQLYYNTVDNGVWYWDGTIWVSASGDITAITPGNGLSANGGNSTVNSGAVTLDINVDNSTLEISEDSVRIKAGGVTANELASNSVTNVKIIDKAITFNKIQDVPTMTVIGRVAAGSGVTSAIAILNETNLGSNSQTSLATQYSIKAYVDSRVASIGTLQGGWVATGTTFPSTASTKKGDYWYVTGAGTVQGQVFNVGDMIIANKDVASTTSVNDWIFLESNRDQATTTILGLVYLATSAEVIAGTDNNKAVTPAGLNSRTATESRTGLIEIATQSEVDTGTDDTRAITPKKLKALLDTRVGGYAANIGDGVATTYTVTHSLNTKDVTIDLYEIATNKKVYADFSAPTINTVSIDFTKAPATAAYRVVIKK